MIDFYHKIFRRVTAATSDNDNNRYNYSNKCGHLRCNKNDRGLWGRMTMERRTFIKMAAGAGLLGLVFGVSKGRASPRLRPPGAEDEEMFLAKCARCGKCAEVCPLGCIQIAHAEDGILSLGTPYMTPLEHPCDLCMKCTEVCSTGALKTIPKEEVRMGIAVIWKVITLITIRP